MCILVVDDDPLICENVKSKMQRLLGTDKYKFKTAHSVVEAELILEKSVPQIVITDLNMPGLSGLVLVKRIKKLYPECCVYVLSGHDDYDLVRQAFLNGADDYLLKPLDIDELRDKVIKKTIKTKELSSVEGGNNWIMEQAVDYINQNICRNITMNDAARNVAISYNYFSKLFREYTGVNFPEYIHKRRIDLSKRYLNDPSVKVAEIARKVGYESAGTYSKVFKKYEGCYPTEYRNISNIATD